MKIKNIFSCGKNGKLKEVTVEEMIEEMAGAGVSMDVREFIRALTEVDDKVAEAFDNVNHPKHYQSDTGIECIDAIRAALGLEGFVAHCRGTAIKYAWRGGNKDELAYAEDLRKGAWYLNKGAEAIENGAE